LSTEPVRRAAMEAARDQDRVAVSGKVTLVQEVETDVQAGFLMFLPVYKADAPHESIAERRQNILGWIYAPFRMNDFMKSLVGSGLKLNNIYFDIIISDQNEIRPDLVMYHYDGDIDPVVTGSRTPLFLFRQTLTFGGHTWTVVVHSPTLFDDDDAFDNGTLMIEVIGSLISLLLAVIVWLAVARRPVLQPSHGLEATSGGGRWGTTAPPYALAAALSLAAGYLVFKADESERQAHARAERAEVDNRVNVIRLRLERALTVPIARISGIAAQIFAHGDIGPEEFKTIAEMLLRGQPTIRNIGVSHGTVLDLIYPLAGNEGALGMDYRRAEWQWPVVKRAIETHTPIVHGPIKLIQGGIGLIARDPVYLPDATGGESRFFGIISIVLDIPAIFAEAGLDRPDLPISVAIRGRDGLGAAGEMISGDPALFDRNPARAEVEFPYGRWLLAAVPKRGWGSDEPPMSMSRLLGGGFFLFVALISFGTANHLIERSRLHRKLASSEERFRLLLQVASDGVHILDREGNLVLSSRSFLDMLGYTPEEA
ncbi:MAG: CHASE domain-containing protein, partial [Rhodospirillaceae bacterium]